MNLHRNRLAAIFSFSVVLFITLLVLSALPQHAALRGPANDVVFALDVAQSKVTWSLGTTFHTVHGSFALKKGTLRLDPATGKASGEIIVDAASGKSGNDSRDKKMHKEVLESGRYPEVVFRPDRVEGRIAPQGTSTVQVHGILVVHGSEHELTVPVQAELAADHWTGNGKFSVPFIDWGLKNPSTFFNKVSHAVEIELELKGNLQGPVTP
jgi:polyisoprenoid-binding protein YceI